MLLTFPDLFLMFHMVIESVQLIALGPSFDHYAAIIAIFPELVDLRLEEIFNLTKDYFYYLVVILVSLVFAYFIAVVLRFADRKLFSTSKLPHVILNLLEQYIHLIVMVGYIPILTSLLDTQF